jgi:hypothetical protein
MVPSMYVRLHSSPCFGDLVVLHKVVVSLAGMTLSSNVLHCNEDGMHYRK